jgi:hypothetical protein
MNISDKLRSLTHSLDIQMTKLYFWCGNFVIQLDGIEMDDESSYYPFVLPNGFSWHTPSCLSIGLSAIATDGWLSPNKNGSHDSKNLGKLLR